MIFKSKEDHQQQQKAEEVKGNVKNVASTSEEKTEYFRMDLNKLMVVMNLISRNMRNQPHAYMYLEPDKNKDIAQIIPAYGFEKCKNEIAAKKLEADATSNSWS